MTRSEVGGLYCTTGMGRCHVRTSLHTGPRIGGILASHVGHQFLVDAREALFGITQEEAGTMGDGLYAAYSPSKRQEMCPPRQHADLPAYEKRVEEFGISALGLQFLGWGLRVTGTRCQNGHLPAGEDQEGRTCSSTRHLVNRSNTLRVAVSPDADGKETDWLCPNTLPLPDKMLKRPSATFSHRS